VFFRLPCPQHFAIDFGDTISDGVPAPGAVDRYTFDAAVGQEAIFDWLSGSNVLIGWQLAAPDATVLFDTFLQDHELTLPQTGVYTLTVAGNSVDDFGTYSFALLEGISRTWELFIPVVSVAAQPAPERGQFQTTAGTECAVVLASIDSVGACHLPIVDSQAGNAIKLARIGGDQGFPVGNGRCHDQ
jgi:hypothetical protein